MSEELKPCPFCSGNNITIEHLMDVVFCNDCGAEMSGDAPLGNWNTRPIEDALRAEIARRDEELLELNNDKAVFIKFENEDELPAEIKDDVYSAMFECSHVDGVRLFPYIEENGQKYFLVMLKEVV